MTKCPFCGCPKQIEHGDRAYLCTKCKAVWEPDEAGFDPTCSPGDPSRRMTRDEERRERQQRHSTQRRSRNR